MQTWLLIKQVRSLQNLTQTEFGQDIKVNLQEVSKWERNVITIPDGKLFRLYWLCINKYNLQRPAMDCIKELNRRMKV